MAPSGLVPPADSTFRTPDRSRLHPDHPRYRELLRLHEEAIATGVDTYRDPDTGLEVLTAAALWARGSCCGCGCRHCPYVFRRARLRELPR